MSDVQRTRYDLYRYYTQQVVEWIQKEVSKYQTQTLENGKYPMRLLEPNMALLHRKYTNDGKRFPAHPLNCTEKAIEYRQQYGDRLRRGRTNTTSDDEHSDRTHIYFIDILRKIHTQMISINNQISSSAPSTSNSPIPNLRNLRLQPTVEDDSDEGSSAETMPLHEPKLSNIIFTPEEDDEEEALFRFRELMITAQHHLDNVESIWADYKAGSTSLSTVANVQNTEMCKIWSLQEENEALLGEGAFGKALVKSWEARSGGSVPADEQHHLFYILNWYIDNTTDDAADPTCAIEMYLLCALTIQVCFAMNPTKKPPPIGTQPAKDRLYSTDLSKSEQLWVYADQSSKMLLFCMYCNVCGSFGQRLQERLRIPRNLVADVENGIKYLLPSMYRGRTDTTVFKTWGGTKTPSLHHAFGIQAFNIVRALLGKRSSDPAIEFITYTESTAKRLERVADALAKGFVTHEPKEEVKIRISRTRGLSAEMEKWSKFEIMDIATADAYKEADKEEENKEEEDKKKESVEVIKNMLQAVPVLGAWLYMSIMRRTHEYSEEMSCALVTATAAAILDLTLVSRGFLQKGDWPDAESVIQDQGYILEEGDHPDEMLISLSGRANVVAKTGGRPPKPFKQRTPVNDRLSGVVEAGTLAMDKLSLKKILEPSEVRLVSNRVIKACPFHGWKQANKNILSIDANVDQTKLFIAILQHEAEQQAGHVVFLLPAVADLTDFLEITLRRTHPNWFESLNPIDFPQLVVYILDHSAKPGSVDKDMLQNVAKAVKRVDKDLREFRRIAGSEKWAKGGWDKAYTGQCTCDHIKSVIAAQK
ncbi:hypothetical protein F5Y16DRAFT_423215 [Xylariaceae sp. FL0255]|nr:hypothetical protein F5Y16DRAFT_423215 [Xylariaceae sp. FL0255]